jgi:hypothetical protein
MNNLLKILSKAFVLPAILLTSIAGMLPAQKIAIIDAGSSGSRLYVYDVKGEGKIIKVVYPTQEQAATSKGRALSSVVNHSDSVKAFLDTMTSKYNSNETIPLYILATAGMRMVSEGKADSIYEKIRSQPRVHNGFRLETAMTISGRYEGLYAWIAANKNTDRYGILEIGGASMQIAFATNKPCDTCISRNGKIIYSKSYLGGGVDQVYNKHKNENPPVFTEGLNDVSNLYDKDPVFIGLGKPIENVLDSTGNSSVEVLNKYARSLANNDSLSNFHPWINAHYIAWVVETMKLGGKLSKPANKSDWTEGAALDILINKEKPEKFNYQTEN